MLRNYSNSDQILKETQKKFGEFIQPTILSQVEFYKLFRPKKSIGQGAYGTIKCVENCYGEEYAIKQSKDNEDNYGLYREVSIMKKFNHPNLHKVIGFYQIKQSQKLIILSEFCKYSSLKVFSPHLSSFSFKEKCRLCVQIFNGIYALHMKNIMHRDLKPDNVLIDGNKHAKICDFGFCKYDIETDLSKTLRVGTPLYNSPETQQGTYTKKCDIFSYGLIVYFIFSNGRHLFRKTESLQDLKSSRKQHFKLGTNAFQNLEVQDWIKQLLQNTITEKQEKRYSTVQVKQFWQRSIDQNCLKELKVSDSKQKYGSMISMYEEDRKTLSAPNQNALNDLQRFVLQLIPRNVKNIQAFQELTKLIELCTLIQKIQEKAAQFKQQIEKADMKLTEKNIVSFGFFFMLEIHLQNVISLGTKLLDSEFLNDKNDLTGKFFNFLSSTLFMRQFLIKNLLKSTIYLNSHRNLIKPADLFSNFMLNCLEDAKKQDQFPKDVFDCQQKIEELKRNLEIETNQELYKMIDQKHQLTINLTTFKIQFDEMMSKFKRYKQNLSDQDQGSKVYEIVDKLRQIESLKF